MTSHLAPPPQAPPYPEERRLATVLFADVQGFTALAEHLDFELVSDLIKDMWLELDQLIEKHGGYIDKHIGDAVMAVWGVPSASEDDAEHAVAAALALQAALAQRARGFATAQPEMREIKMRVGINTGMVMSSYVGVRGEYTVMGDTVNVASRMEQSAEAGTVVVSEATYRLVRGAFRMHRLPPLELKGKAEPLTAFFIEGAVMQPSRVRYHSQGGLKTRMVGRELELQKLAQLYQRMCRAKQPIFALVASEAGLGKSRLLMEFTTQLELDEANFTLLSARGLAQTTRAPFYLWKSLWYNRFGLSDDDPPELAREKFLRGITTLWGTHLGKVSALEIAHHVGHLVGIEWPHSPHLASYARQPSTAAQRSFELMGELLQRVRDMGPMVLLLDDLHYADSGSLDLLNELMQKPLPILILAGVRPDALRPHPLWPKITEAISLAPLRINAELITAAYPNLKALPNAVLKELAQRADGNPYFLEEMVKSLVQSDLWMDHAQSLKLVRERLPDSLHSMLQARLDALSPEARHIALLASVVGRVFWEGAVLAAARQPTQTTALLKLPTTDLKAMVHSALTQLVRLELAFPRKGSAFASEPEYIFKHALLRDVAYGLLPLKHRRLYHLSVGYWLISRAGPDFDAVIAEHLEQAGELQKAAFYYTRAANYAQVRGAPDEADWLRARAASIPSTG
jgi:class 3 adenylate cyclase